MAKKFKLKGKHLLGPGVGNEVTLYPMTVADNVTMEKDGTLYSIQEAVNNGAFNGKDGEDGKPGPQGPMGDTSIVTSDGTINVEQTLSNSTGKVPSSHAVHEHVETHYAQKNGFYEEMAVGLAENIISPDGITDEEPYIYRTSAGSTSISTGVAEIKSLYGNSIVWNQSIVGFQSNVWIAVAGTKTINGDICTYTASDPKGGVIQYLGYMGINHSINNHYYYVSFDIMPNDDYYIYFGGTANINNDNLLVEGGKWTRFEDIRHWTGDTSYNENLYFSILKRADGTTPQIGDGYQIKNVMRIDITQMFGEGNEPTLEQFKQWFPNDYYEYNEGEIINVNIDGLRTIGFNQWNEEWESGQYDSNNGGKTANNTRIRCKDYIRVFPNTYYTHNKKYELVVNFFDINKNIIQYTPSKSGDALIVNKGADAYTNTPSFKTPSNCAYIVFFAVNCPTYKNDITINIEWSGYRNGDYEPYQEHNINIPVKEIKDADNNLLFPDGLCSAGSVRDEITPTKAIKRISKQVQLPNIINTSYWYSDLFYVANIMMGFYEQQKPRQLDSGVLYNILSNTELVLFNSNKSTGDTINGNLYIKIPNLSNTPTEEEKQQAINTINNALKGAFLQYELETPIEVEFKEVPQTFGDKLNLTYFVDDFGTEEFTTDSTTAPVKHSTFYMTNLRDKIRNIDGNTDSGALMNPSVDNLLLTLGNALNGTFTKQWDGNNKKWQFTFTPNQTNQLTDALEARQHTESDE